jgi:ABC-2 type transport system ATP-binding protein
LASLPELSGFELEQLDSNSLAVTIDKNQDINAVFSMLDQQGVLIKSMRNKTNRLEQLFVSLLQNSSTRSLTEEEV